MEEVDEGNDRNLKYPVISSKSPGPVKTSICPISSEKVYEEGDEYRDFRCQGK